MYLNHREAHSITIVTAFSSKYEILDSKNLLKGCRLAEACNIWVHLYGTNVLPYLVLRTEHNQLANSFTLDYSKWIQNPTLPYLVRSTLSCLFKHFKSKMEAEKIY